MTNTPSRSKSIWLFSKGNVKDRNFITNLRNQLRTKNVDANTNEDWTEKLPASGGMLVELMRGTRNLLRETYGLMVIVFSPDYFFISPNCTGKGFHKNALLDDQTFVFDFIINAHKVDPTDFNLRPLWLGCDPGSVDVPTEFNSSYKYIQKRNGLVILNENIYHSNLDEIVKTVLLWAGIGNHQIEASTKSKYIPGLLKDESYIPMSIKSIPKKKRNLRNDV